MAHAFVIKADAGSAPGFDIQYFVDHTTTNVTAAVEAGTYVSPVLASGDTFRLRVVVKVSTATPRGSQIERLLTADSAAVDLPDDTVGFSVRRK